MVTEHLFQSKVVPAALLSPSHRRQIELTALQVAYRHARDSLPTDILVARAMLPSDLAETNELWGHTTGSSGNTWENSLIANQTIADNTWIAIYGGVDTSSGHYISAMRWTIGSAKRAHWSTFDYFSDDTRIEARTFYALSPLVITKAQKVTLEYYVMGSGGTSQSVQIAFLGWVVEKAGKNLDP